MTIDEAIKHAEEVAEDKEIDIENQDSLFPNNIKECKECAEEHRHIHITTLTRFMHNRFKLPIPTLVCIWLPVINNLDARSVRSIRHDLWHRPRKITTVLWRDECGRRIKDLLIRPEILHKAKQLRGIIAL